MNGILKPGRRGFAESLRWKAKLLTSNARKAWRRTPMILSYMARSSRRLRVLVLGIFVYLRPVSMFAQNAAVTGHMNIFTPSSTPAIQISHLAILVFTITGAIFLFVATLLAYVVFRFRARGGESTEPPQVYGSSQIELAWTVIPVLIVIVLFLATAR